MTVLVWDQIGEHKYQAGVDHGVLYLPDGSAIVWNGLTDVEDATPQELRSFYQDNLKYLEYLLPGDFAGSIKAITYPDELDALVGIKEVSPGLAYHDQPASSFGLSYRTKIGNDIDGLDHGYKIHILYNVLANPDPEAFPTLNDQAQAVEFSWTLTGKPQLLSAGYRPTAHISIDSTRISSLLLSALEAILYGTESDAPRLPSADEVYSLIIPRLEPEDFPTAPLRLYHLVEDPQVNHGSQSDMDLTLTGDPPRNSFNGMSFDGSTQYVQANNTGLPIDSDVQSYGIRFKTNHSDFDTSNNRGLLVWLGTHGLWTFETFIQAYLDFGDHLSTDTINDNQWHLVIIVIDPSEVDGHITKLYLDGNLVDLSVNSITDAFETSPWDTNMAIGTDFYPDDTRIFIGNLKDAFICDYALTDSDIATLWAKVAP